MSRDQDDNIGLVIGETEVSQVSQDWRWCLVAVSCLSLHPSSQLLSTTSRTLDARVDVVLVKTAVDPFFESGPCYQIHYQPWNL